MQETWGSIPRSGRSPGEGNGNLLQDSCQDNPMGRGVWWLQPMGPKESDTTKQLNNSLSCLLGNLRDVSYSPLSAIHTLQGLNKCFVVIVQSLSHIWLFVTPWSVAHQAPLPMGLSWQESWSRLPFPSPGDFPNPGIEPKSLASLALADGFLTSASHGEPYHSTQT